MTCIGAIAEITVAAESAMPSGRTHRLSIVFLRAARFCFAPGRIATIVPFIVK